MPAGQQLAEVEPARAVAGRPKPPREPAVGAHPGRDRGIEQLDELGIDDRGRRAGVLDDVPQPGAAQLGVDRHEHDAEQRAAEPDVEELEAVGEHHRERVPLAQADGGERGGRCVRGVQALGERAALAITRDEQRVRGHLGASPEHLRNRRLLVRRADIDERRC
jgi:hypothetical protein